jgi:hypothetical protein
MTTTTEKATVHHLLNEMLVSTNTPIDPMVIAEALVASAVATATEAQAFGVLIARKGEITTEQVKVIVGALRKTGAAAEKLRATVEVVLLAGVTARKGEGYQQVLSAVREAARKGVPMEDIVPAVEASVSASKRKEVSFTSAAATIKGLGKRPRVVSPETSVKQGVRSIKTNTVKVLEGIGSSALTDEDKTQVVADLRVIIINAEKALNQLLGESK